MVTETMETLYHLISDSITFIVSLLHNHLLRFSKQFVVSEHFHPLILPQSTTMQPWSLASLQWVTFEGFIYYILVV